MAAALLSACSLTPDPAEAYVPAARDGFGTLPGTCIEFDGFTAGQTVDVAYTATGVGPVGVYGQADGTSGNAARILDTGSPGTQTDLGTPNELFGGPGQGEGGFGFYFNAEAMGNALVVSDAPGLASTAPDARLTFDFSAMASVTVYRVTLIDVDATESGRAKLYGRSGQLLMDLPFIVTGNNGVAELNLGGLSGVRTVALELGGAVAVDRFCFAADTAAPVVDTTDPGCTRTIGYWKNHTGFGPQEDAVTALLPIALGSPGGAHTLLVADAATARDVLKQNVYGNPSNGITKLYAQLLAAKLNVAAGASPEAVSAELQAADAFLAGHDHTAWAALGAAQRDGTLVWKDAFDAFNNGLIGPGHCGDGDDGGERPRGEHPGRGNAAAVW